MRGDLKSLWYFDQITPYLLTADGRNIIHLVNFSVAITDKQIITIDLVNTGNLPAQTLFELVLPGFHNPVQSDREHGFIISTRDTHLELVDQSATVPLVVTLPSDFSANIAIFHDSGSRLINQRSGVRLDLNSTIPLPQGCLFTITIPSSLARNLTTNLRFVYIQGFFGNLRSVPFIFITDREIEIRDICSTHSIVGDAVGSIKLKYLQNPDSVRITDSFGIKISDQDGNTLARSFENM